MPRTPTRRQFLKATIASAGFGALSAGAPSGEAATSPAPALTVAAAPTPARKGGTLRFGSAADFTGFDPTNFGTFQDWIPTFYDTLIREDAQLQPHPELAESWELSRDGLTFTARLRKGVTFHNGRELEAKDVVYSVKRTADPKTAANIRGMLAPIKGAEARDKYTVELKFEKPYPALFDALDLLFIHPEEAGDNIKTKPVGTGPFLLEQWTPGSKVTLKRHPNYWRPGAPSLDVIDIQILPDSQARMVALEAGTEDAIDRPAYIDMARLHDDKRYQLIAAGMGSTMLTVYFNVTRAPFDNKKVRQAFSYSLNRPRITQNYTRGFSRPQCLPWRKEVFAFQPDLEGTCKFDLDKAKQLLAEAGFASGLEVPINVSTEGYSPGSKVAAEILQADIAKIGVKLNIAYYEAAAARQRLTTGDFQVAAHGYGRAHRDPATLFGGALPFYNKSQITKFESAEYGKLIEEGASTTEMEKRKAIYKRLTEIIADEAFVLSVCPLPRTYAIRATVEGMDVTLEGMMDLRSVSLRSG